MRGEYNNTASPPQLGSKEKSHSGNTKELGHETKGCQSIPATH